MDEDGKFLREAEADEIGEVCLKGPNVFRGYLDEAHNRRIWPLPEWFNTGDLGRQDQDGYFWLTGRRKELIIRGGHNIDPAVIEEPLYRLAEVKVAAAVGSPDPYAGEIPVAYVELKQETTITKRRSWNISGRRWVNGPPYPSGFISSLSYRSLLLNTKIGPH